MAYNGLSVAEAVAGGLPKRRFHIVVRRGGRATAKERSGSAMLGAVAE